jgi:Flp pilus assembly protein TadG
VTVRAEDRTGRAGEDGAAIIEFAAVGILFMTLLWGILAYGFVFVAQHAITHAASEGALAAAGIRTSPDDAGQPTYDFSAARDVVEAQLGGGITAAYQVDVGRVTCGSSQCVQVDVSLPWGDEAIVPFPFGPLPDRLSSRAVVEAWG